MSTVSVLRSVSKLSADHWASNTLLGIVLLCTALGVAHNTYAAPAQIPLFQSNAVKPIMMLNMSKDHQLYFKVYDDYSDITDLNGLAPDGVPDTTYVTKYEYYGYYDSKKCYGYNAGKYFEPVALATTTDHYCTAGANQWSGNFLNWASMTRMDAIRKILYGGFRSTDSGSATILERAFLPNDAHSFAKYYNNADLPKLTPFAANNTDPDVKARGITICNTSEPTDRSKMSHETIGADLPLMRVARGNYSLWASNERWQCRWGVNSNGNVEASSEIYAYSNSPATSAALPANNGDYVVRVKVCVSSFVLQTNENESCKLYGSVYKPTGLLHTYGENDSISFGLLTGTYSKNKSGGVLRKKVGSITDEINNVDGTFKVPSAGSIVKTLDLLRIYGYRFDDGTYHSKSGSDDCVWSKSSFNNGQCTNWGNPQAELYLESLRYLAGKSAPNSTYDADDSTKITGLKRVSTWSDPITTAANGNYCAPLNVLQFNASTTSYDTDDLSAASTFTEIAGYDQATNDIGTAEGIEGKYTFIGQNGTNNDQICGQKKINGLSNAKGICPESPRLEGGYKLAGLAYLARWNGIAANRSKVQTYGVSLSPAVPRVVVPVPGTTASVTILPACRNLTANPNASCAIVDFKIVKQSVVNGTVYGKLYVNWEDSEQGGDFDQDMWGLISYEVSSSKVKVTTQVVAQSTGDKMGFGYVISGTDRDGFHVYSGVNNFNWPTGGIELVGCNNCQNGNAAKSDTFNVGTSNATSLYPPLYYAAKWGGYSASFEKTTKAAAAAANKTSQADIDQFLKDAIKARDPSLDSYYYATDPRALAASLAKAFQDISAGVGAATSVATVSAKVSDGDYVYQAQFNSENWSGDLHAYSFVTNGALSANPVLCSSSVIVAGNTVCTGVMPNTSSGRNIYTNKSGAMAALGWSNLTATQQALLQLSTEPTNAQAIKRVDWLAGNATYETTATGGILRDRGVVPNRKLLGDVVNSSPVYVGSKNFRYDSLSGAAGSSYAAFVTAKQSMKKMLMVGSNDGMLHAFDADTLEELFAFIPNASFANLANLTMPEYGTATRPHTYFVDGPLTYGDAYISGAWRRIVVGTMGAGAKTIFAVDVTDAANPSLLFELDATSLPGMGFVMGKPSILPMRNGRFAVVFGNGDTSGATSTSKLFVVDLQSPLNSSYTKILDAGEGTGLSAPAIEVNGIGEAVNVYAGDLDGNLWRFDLQDTNPSNWKKLYKLFKALSPTSVAQPITASPTLGINASKSWKTMVYFGTGKYYEVGDVGNTTIQSFYAIADIGSTVSSSTLLQKTMTNSVASTVRTRIVSQINPNWSSQNGWYLNFDDQVNTNGERITVKPLLLFDKLIFQTLIPSVNACDHGGSSWLMEIPAVGDKYIGKTLLNPNLYNPYLILGELSFVYNKSTGGASVISNPSSSGVGIQQSALTLPVQVEGRESWHQAQ